MRSCSHRRLVACLPAFLCAVAGLAHADPVASVIYLRPGESPALAIHHAQAGWRWDRVLSQAALFAASTQTAKLANPVLTAGTVIPATIEVGKQFSYPTVQFSYKVSVPLESVIFDFASPNGVQAFSMIYNNAILKKTGTVTFQSPTGFPPYTQPGKWPLQSVEIIDELGDYTIYGASQIAHLFTNDAIDVHNAGLVDAAPPAIESGALLTQTVSAGANPSFFKASVTASDSGSGYYGAYVFIEPPGSNVSFAQTTPLPLPVAHGTDVSYADLSGNTIGTWNIVAYSVCDAANNCTSSSRPDDILALLGQDTFSVTQ